MYLSIFTTIILQSASPDIRQRLTAAAIALLIALLIAWIGVSNMKAKLKSVRKEQTANRYIREDSLTLTSQRDLFLHKQLEKRPKAEKSKEGNS
ncbi:MAG TPA: hypothetical protein PK646_01085 [Bacillota bacterium]|jgi:hypothetical protein|nr:hypothetical protein [Fastidiosipila sp.]HPX92934.1 hypothetical protein [Bacillota bacterium]HQB80675.1 hypothetical protein [Bacillota bacterium]